MGNQFLATIRQCDAIVHVVRCFEDDNVIHVDGSVDPVRDAELINLELAFSDLASVEKRLLKLKKDLKSGKADPAEGTALEKIYEGTKRIVSTSLLFAEFLLFFYFPGAEGDI